MNKKLLTIAVATYNMEEYLSLCIETLLVPSILKDLEILIINDGSKDSSSKIAHDYSIKYPESILVVDRENGGYGSALNKAMELASGKYFKILDPDDRFDSEVLKTYIAKLRETDCDLIVTHFSYEDMADKTSTNFFYKGIEYDTIYDFRDFVFADQLNAQEIEMHAITYKTEILRKNNFQLSECYYCDTDYTTYPLRHVNDIIFFDLVLYKYYIGREQQSVSNMGFAYHFKDHEYITKKLINYYTTELSDSDSAFSSNVGYKAARIMCTHINIMYGALSTLDKSRAEKEIKSFKEYVQTIDSELKEIAEEVFNISEK